jgi:hypothetical protein
MATADMQQKLAQVFNDRQAQVLAGVIQAAYSDLVRTSDFNELKEIVRDLAVAQQRTEQRMEELAAAQQRTEQRMEELAVAQHDLAAAQQRTEQRMEELAVAQQRTEHALTTLAITVGDMQPRLALVDGWRVERRYIDRAASYFGRWLRQIRVLWPGALDHTFEQRLDASLSEEEKDQVLLLDAIILGKTKSAPPEVIYVALKASVTIHIEDVERARVRAVLLRRTGVRVVPVVAGEKVGLGAEEAARSHAVAMLRDGYRQGWDEAIAAA